ncbi:P-loop containing nucleoside triphosphate hydrolase protein [Armillaria solidipes]|uniref:RNA helicase n=1 Tax=Armillaria solidipes TaxID=1076256 RepID=A0A2H3BQN7_9AGAR|nr:P-loop containing nucleoside triphosphate hydrolase protein [Armillaria solidipes]
MPGLLSCLTEVVGTGSQPTPIQALSLQHLLETEYDPNKKWKEYLLASETGSGKSIAYFLPLLQSLKVSELSGNVHRKNTHPLNPRALILAPTHELARQLSGFAKDLIHEIKLRILCASQANVDNKMSLGGGSAAQMKGKLDAALFSNHSQDLQVRPGGRFPVDVVVGTPMKLLELIKGRGWERRIGNETPKAQEESTEEGEEKKDEEFQRKPRRGRDLGVVPTGTLGAAPEMGLANVEWVIVDEADVLFDPDFQETTRLLLSEVSAARGSPVPYYPDDFNFKTESVEPKPISYPYNLILCSATIPSALGNYLETHHPSHTRLASPTVHHLPKKLQTEYVGWTGTNKNADIEKRIRKVWAEDSITRSGKLSKILVFCNKNIKVQLLSQHLEGKGIKTVAIDGTAETRRRGSNHHLDGFLKDKSEEKVATKEEGAGDPSETPHVMITTSLLSRGLDFSPQIKHVFIVDEPRNMIDFIHRAGRSGRAGEKGKVVVFGKLEGRGSSRAVDLRKRVGALAA